MLVAHVHVLPSLPSLPGSITRHAALEAFHERCRSAQVRQVGTCSPPTPWRSVLRACDSRTAASVRPRFSRLTISYSASRLPRSDHPVSLRCLDVFALLAWLVGPLGWPRPGRPGPARCCHIQYVDLGLLGRSPRRRRLFHGWTPPRVARGLGPLEGRSLLSLTHGGTTGARPALCMPAFCRHCVYPRLLTCSLCSSVAQRGGHYPQDVPHARQVVHYPSWPPGVGLPPGLPAVLRCARLVPEEEPLPCLQGGHPQGGRSLRISCCSAATM